MITIHATKQLYAQLPAKTLLNPNSNKAVSTNDIDNVNAASKPHTENPLSGWHANMIHPATAQLHYSGARCHTFSAVYKRVA